MIERLGKPVAIAVATGALLAGCADVSPNSEPQVSVPRTEVTAPLEPGTTIAPPAPECTTLSTEAVGDSTNMFVSFQAINASLLQKHVPFEPIITVNPVTHEKNPTVERSASFLRITKNDTGSLCYISEATDTASKPQIDNLLLAVSANAPYIRSAIDNDELDVIDFRMVSEEYLLDDYSADAPAYSELDVTSGKEQAVISYPLDPRSTISVEDVRTMLRHETIHALTSKADLSNGNQVTDLPRAKDFADACRSLRNIAIVQATNGANSVIANLRTISEHLDQAQVEIINNVIASVEDGSFGDLQPVSGSYDSDTTTPLRDGNVAECRAIGPWYVARREMDKQQIDDKNISQLMIDDPTFSEVLPGVIDDWNNLFRQKTIYQTLREAPYMTKADITGFEGHPWDNWDETITSLLNVAVTYPDTFVSNVHQLPSEQAKAIKDLLGHSNQVFKQLHPEMNDVNATLEHVYSQI